MPSKKGRILCMDDNPDSRDVVHLTLMAEGYEIICVESGREAIDLVRREHFDLLIFDNWLPDLTGTEVTKIIREFNQTTPILFYSAAAYDSDKRAAFEAGAQAYLVKPVGIDELVPQVEKLIGTDASRLLL
jgi:two-component system OmpR family response regulator